MRWASLLSFLFVVWVVGMYALDDYFDTAYQSVYRDGIHSL